MGLGISEEIKMGELDAPTKIRGGEMSGDEKCLTGGDKKNSTKYFNRERGDGGEGLCARGKIISLV